MYTTSIEERISVALCKSNYLEIHSRFHGHGDSQLVFHKHIQSPVMAPLCLPATWGVLQHYRELQTCRKTAFTIPTEQTKHLVERGDKK